jgi:hypothetical protein
MLKYDPIKETIKFWWEYRDKDINYKNWWNMKDTIEGGILNKDFIKKHLQRETELEDKVFELENKIKELKKFKTKALKESIGVDDIGARLLTKIAMRMQIQMPEMTWDIGSNSIGNRNICAGTATLSVDDVWVDGQEIEYLRELVAPTLTSVIDNAISSKVSADISTTQLMNNYAADKADAGPSMYGLGGSFRRI